ncbi:hypothetical protein RD110_08805 [Rhodoferax koreense]|uniref:Uncharacterized protein n=1 Tax=Rhodoferax koreensis TaxID=1842727 RepID=A0A1P8JU30_9BURK|nr:hypothetical protein [Rhodoferax koreense]APW37280.1 hypothetical protein RD110_08805 [Rhodoferax koreense]
MSVRRWIAVLWSGFLLACGLEMMVFGLVDPADLRWGGEGLGTSRQTVYALSFFAFWAASAVAGALAVHLATSPPDEEMP